MQLTVREKIIQAIGEALSRIHPANGFQRAYRNVLRGRVDPSGIKSFPSIVYFDGSETSEDVPHGHETLDMAITVEVWVAVNSPLTLSEELNVALGDIRHGMLADHTFGGLVLHIAYLGAEPNLGEVAAPLGMVSAMFNIRYRTRYGDPYTQF